MPSHLAKRALGFFFGSCHALTLISVYVFLSSQAVAGNNGLSDFGVFATGTGCGVITISGNSFTDSFDSSQGSYSQTRLASVGVIGANGNINLSGSAIVNGSVVALNTAVGPCQNGTPGITISNNARVTGGYIKLSAPVPFPSPGPVVPGTTNYNFSADASLSPGSYGNIAMSGGHTLTLAPGTYNINSINLSGNSRVTIKATGQVFILVAGTNVSQPIQLSGGSIYNPSGIPLNFQLVYGGSLPSVLSGGSMSYAYLYAPNSPATLSGGADWFGAMVVNSLNDSGGSPIHYDRSLAVPPAITSTLSPLPNGAHWNKSNVTVSFACSDSILGIASCTSPIGVTTEGKNQVVTGTAVNKAGIKASVSVSVNVDKTPPTMTAAATPVANAAGWNNSSVTVTFTCNDSVSGVASCPPPKVVNTEGSNQIIFGTALDNAGNSASTSVTVNLDKTPPSLTIVSPPNGQTISLGTTSVTVIGSEGDALSGVAGVTCNGGAATISGSKFACTVSLMQGSNSILVQATDTAGNSTTSPLTLVYAPAPRITITSPTNLSVTNITPVTVAGTVSDPSATLNINGIVVPQSSGSFSISVPLVEGLNVLTAVATNTSGVTGSATAQITLDTTPPHITIDSPADGTITTDPSVTVTGIANDVVVGTVNAQDVQVSVNGVAAQVANRTYSASSVPLSLGKNTIQAKGVDRAGNGTTTSITVTLVLPSQPPAPAIGQAVITESLSIVSGNNQAGTIGIQLSAPLAVMLLDTSSHPVPNQSVIFKVTGSDGTLSPSSSGASSAAVAVTTDATGKAQAFWTLGQRSGAGINTVQVSSALAIGPANFTATAVTGNPSQIVVDSGNGQTGVLGQALPFPFVAAVVDSGHNRVANVAVTFTVKQGGGSFAGATSQVVNTDSNGRAIAVLTVGLQEGFDNNVVEASFPGNTGFPAAFSASAKAPGNPANTTISGVVLDNSNNPIPGATIRLFQTNQGNNNNLPVQIGTPVQTTAQGTFLIPSAPVGSFKLMADGTTATNSTSYPTLEYDIVTVAGNDNTVGMPIYLPALDTVDKLCVDATHGGTLTLPLVPGFSLSVLPGSATFPGGSKQGCISVTPVNGDKVPMAPGFGQQPRFIVTIQPVGTTFNPPAAMTLPNVDGLPPKSVTEMYSYDHDLGMFIAIGTGTVSPDGSVIASNPGVGVLKAGWHCGGNPNSSGSAGTCPNCQTCQGSGCVADPTQDMHVCHTASVPNGVCQSGQCVPATVTIDASFINQDDPTNTAYQSLPQGDPVYAGSESSTSDSLQLTATPSPSSLTVATYTWSVTGPGSSNYTPPPPSPTASQWTVGKIMSSPGTLTFQVTVAFAGGAQAQSSRDVDVGVRTDDTIVVGWINQAGVTLPGGASPAVTGLLTPPPVPSPLQCNLFALDLSENFTTPNFIPLTLADRSYVLNWMFKYAGNTDPSTVIPGGDFRNSTTSFTDDNKVANFVGTPTNFKLFNRFQVKFRVGPGGTFNGTPIVLHQQTGIGTTKNPCGAIAGFFGLFAGQAGPANGPPPVASPTNTRDSVINDGSPDDKAIRAFDTLTGKDLPAGVTAVFWENIGTRISFNAGGGPAPNVVVQPYPTYYEYHNGKLVTTTPQAASPLGNFQTNPYPFGTVACLGLGGITPGGRCGDASSPADPSARVPQFTVP